MISFYAFCRLVDDIADDPRSPPEEKKRELDAWRQAVLADDGSLHPVLAETLPLAARHGFERGLLAEIIEGVASDQERDRYETFDDLLRYCYKVASVVGIVSSRIFGARHPASRDYAINLGYALQLTNILRDVGQDARETGRIYLPLEDLRKFGVAERQILAGESSEALVRLMDFEHERARGYYQLAASQLPAEDRRRMIAARMMAAIYSEILEKLQRERYRVFEHRVSLSRMRKGSILASHLIRGLIGL